MVLSFARRARIFGLTATVTAVLLAALLAACSNPPDHPDTAPRAALSAACHDLADLYASWFSAAATSQAVVERLHLFPALDPKKATSFETDQVIAATDKLYAKIIDHSDLYVRHLKSAVNLYGAELRVLAVNNTEYGKRPPEIVKRVRWAFDETTTAWTGLETLCPSPAVSPAVAAPGDALAQARRHVDIFAAELAMPRVEPHVSRCDTGGKPPADDRFQATAEADVTVSGTHLDAMTQAAMKLRDRYRITALRETVSGSGQARLDLYELASGTRITVVSHDGTRMRTTVNTLCFLPPPGTQPFTG